MRTREATPSEDAADDAANAADAAYGERAVDQELLRDLCKRRFQALSEEDVQTLDAYFSEKELLTVDGVIGHFERLYQREKSSVDTKEMAFKKLCQFLVSKNKLGEHISGCVYDDLLVAVPGTSRADLRACTLRQLLELATKVCERYVAEEKDRNSSEYEKALKTLEDAEELDLVVRAHWRARGELYKDEGVLASCVNVKTFNETFLGTSFDKTLHLPAGALDLSFGDYTPHLAAEPGAASRLALSKFAQVPTRRPQLISNLIIRVDGVVEAPPRRRRRATPSTHSFRAGRPSRPDSSFCVVLLLLGVHGPTSELLRCQMLLLSVWILLARTFSEGRTRRGLRRDRVREPVYDDESYGSSGLQAARRGRGQTLGTGRGVGGLQQVPGARV